MAKPNDLAALRMRFAPGGGERPGGNPVLSLCDEVERLRAEKVQLAAAAGAALDWATARGCFVVAGDGPLGETFPIFAEVVAPALNDALAGNLDLAKFAKDLEEMSADSAPEGGA